LRNRGGLCQLRTQSDTVARMAVAKNSRLTLACILTTILLDMVGLGIIVPVLPELIEQLTGSGIAQSAVVGGYLVFVYALMQFLML
jgi:DHA1 family tetracycline resistance protein-like MFS transporter